MALTNVQRLDATVAMYLEGEHQLVAFKQPQAGVVIYIICERFHNVTQACLQCGGLQHTSCCQILPEPQTWNKARFANIQMCVLHHSMLWIHRHTARGLDTNSNKQVSKQSTNQPGKSHILVDRDRSPCRAYLLGGVQGATEHCQEAGQAVLIHITDCC